MIEMLGETLKRVAADIQKDKTTFTPEGMYADLAGDPSCPICHGIGYLRTDVPVGHVEFGKLQPCECLKRILKQRAQKRLYNFSHLDKLQDKTFENFMPRGKIGLAPQQGDSLERSYNHALQFAQHLHGWLLLQGRYGCGKTHLAAAIANYIVGLGIPTLFLTVPDLLDTLRFAYNDPETTFEEQFEQIRQIDLLVLDDFGTQNATPWAQEKLFQILNFRYINQMPLVVTTNLTLESVDGRIRSRLKDPELVTKVMMVAPDYRDALDDKGQAEISSLDMLANRTFGNFSDRRGEMLPQEHLQSIDRAFQQARIFAEEPHGWLIFMGGNGCGKTHLAAAIANFRTSMGFPPVFVSMSNLLDHLRATFAPTSVVRFDNVFEEVRTADLLFLDDLFTNNMTPWTREKIYQLLDHRYFSELPTVITTSEDLERLDLRIRSRFNDLRLCKLITLVAPSYTGVQRPYKAVLQNSNTNRTRKKDTKLIDHSL